MSEQSASLRDAIFWEKYGIDPESNMAKAVLTIRGGLNMPFSNGNAVTIARRLERQGLLKD